MYESIQDMKEEISRIKMSDQLRSVFCNMLDEVQEIIDRKKEAIDNLSITINGKIKEKQALEEELNNTKNMLNEQIKHANECWDRNSELVKELEYHKALTENELKNKEDAEQRVRKLKQVIQSIVNQI